MSTAWGKYPINCGHRYTSVSNGQVHVYCVTHVHSWKYSRAIVMDGNFKVEHMLLKNASQELWLMDGKGFMVTSELYKNYLAGSVNQVEVGVPLPQDIHSSRLTPRAEVGL